MLESAGKLKDALDTVRDTSTRQFQLLIDLYRREPLIATKFDEVWIAGLAHRLKIDANARPRDQVISALSAYYHFEKDKLTVAGQNPNYDPYKHKNDLLDSEQLVYLSDPSLQFVTCDAGFARRTHKSSQHGRIHTVPPYLLEDAEKTEALLRAITA